MKNLFKKTMITMCSAVMLMGIGAVSANAATTTVGDFTVDRSKSGYSSPYVVSISAYNGEGGKITLPTTAEINGKEYQITSVGNAFEGNESITGVTIPDGYTEIGLSAFKDCTGLQSVEIPGSVDMISTNAFSGSTRYNFLYGCDALTSITMKDGAQKFATVDNVLYNVSDDEAVMVVYPGGKPETEYTIPTEVNGKAVTSTAMHLFRNNSVLKKVTVPASITSLGGYTFNGMKAIEEIVLEHETAPSIGSEICTEMNTGSKVIVKNEEVAKIFESTSAYTKYYTPEKTTITVAGQTPEVKTVSTSFSVSAEPEIKDGKAVYSIYFDNAENVNTVLLKVSFDAAQVSEGTVTVANDKFTSGTSNWTEENGKLILKAYVGITGNVSGFSSAEKTKLAEIAVPLKANAKGNITAKITDAKAAGVVGEDESAMNGTVTMGTSSANVFVPNYDVNSNGTVDIIDITEAQRYYQVASSDETWAKAKAMDVNGDNKVDIQDYIDIFNHLSDF